MIIVAITALWGAAAAVGGVLLLLGQVELDDLGYGGVDAALSESLLWTVVWLALAIVRDRGADRDDRVSLLPPGESTAAEPPRPARSPGCPEPTDRGERARSEGRGGVVPKTEAQRIVGR